MGTPIRPPLQIITIKQAADQEMAYIHGRQSGKIKSLSTPWKKMNMAGMNGLEWGSINTIAGMSGSGKTAILNNLETGLFDLNKDQQFDVLSFNLEMLARRLVGRKLSSKLGKSVKQLYSADLENLKDNIRPDEIKFLEDYLKTLKTYNIHYVDKSGTVDQIRDTCIWHMSQPSFINSRKGLVITLDHSILVKRKANQTQLDALYELGAMFNDLKKDFKIIVIVVSQLNRDIEKIERKDNPIFHYPQKSDVFGADALYHVSDTFMISHRPQMLNLDTYGPLNMPVIDKIYWHFLKTRDGDPFIARMTNKLEHNRILEDII